MWIGDVIKNSKREKKKSNAETDAGAAAENAKVAAENNQFGRKDSIGYHMQMTLKSFRRMMRETIASEQLNLGVWFFLRALWERDGLSQRELADRVGMEQPTTVSALRSMAANNLVTLDKDPDDKRKIQIFLTDKARRKLERLTPQVAYINTDIAYEGFSARERELFLSMMLRMKNNIDDYLTSHADTGSQNRSKKPIRQLIEDDEVGL